MGVQEVEPAGQSPAADLVVAVRDPLKHGDGLLDSHVVFTVTTKVTRAQFPGPTFDVHRRFSDFVWLRDLLLFELRGRIIPPLPPKHSTKFNKLDPVFLETRRAALQRFLERIAAHPVLSHNESFVKFLTLRSHELITYKKDKERRRTDRLTDSLNSLATRIAIRDVDAAFVSMRTYTERFTAKIAAISGCINKYHSLHLAAMGVNHDLATGFEAMCESDPDMKDVFDELALALRESRKAGLRLLGFVQLSVMEPLIDYLDFPSAVADTLRYRDTRELACQDYMDEVDGRRVEREREATSDQKASLASIMGKDPEEVRRDKLTRIDSLIQEAEGKLESASNSLAVINADVTADYERFIDLKDKELRALMALWASHEVVRYNQACDVWSNCINHLEAALGHADVEAS